jgi:hypothetical protein
MNQRIRLGRFRNEILRMRQERIDLYARKQGAAGDTVKIGGEDITVVPPKRRRLRHGPTEIKTT